MTSPPMVPQLRVEVDGTVDAHLLAAAIRRRVAGDPWPHGPERTVADAVVAERDRTASRGMDQRESRSPWR